MTLTPKRKSTRGRLPSGQPNPIDIHVGTRVRLRRTLLGMSQERLADALGLTFQQVQKYERGANRIGASRLFDLSRVLDVPVSFFFDELSEEAERHSPLNVIKGAPAEEPAPPVKDAMMKRETLELVRAYYKITDVKVRRQVYELAKILAAAEAGSE